jgi:protoheme IX farnesyltransferase
VLRLKLYYRLAKPGIIYGNLLTALAGYLLASRWQIHLSGFISVMVGTSLVIGSACVVNNYLDRNIDRQMARTKKRALVLGEISNRAALIYATTLGLSGSIILILGTNYLTFSLGIIAFIIYVFIYGYSKRVSVHGTLIGGFAGAAPIVAGYTAVSNRLDSASFLLFLIMMIWQMPHFFAIAIYRRDDYAAASIPVLPVKKGIPNTKRQIIAYQVFFLFAAGSLWWYHFVGISYLIVMLLVSLWWLVAGVRGLGKVNDTAWARGVFFRSLIVLCVFAAMTSVGALLP